MSAYIKGKIAAAVTPGCIVGHLNRTRITVVGEAVFFILEGDTVLDDMIDSNFFAAKLEAVAVAVRRAVAV
ncbi:hypothetical protein D3C75_1139570 [compost metagenome]